MPGHDPPRWTSSVPSPCIRALGAAGRSPRGSGAFRVESLRHVGRQLFRAETYVNWCGHGQEVIPLPPPDGLVALVPVRGKVR